jgi:exopolysaccharide biosynthesis polyprenyl glycosylphosphotransferase
MSASDSVTPGLYSEALVRQSLLLRGARKSGWRAALVRCEILVDFGSAALGISAALLLGATPHLLAETAAASVIGGLVAVFDLRANRAYEGGGGLLQIRETERILSASVLCPLVLIPLMMALGSGISKIAIAMAPITVAMALMLQKRCLFWALRGIDRVHQSVDRVVVYGAGRAERRVASALLRSVRLGLHPIAIIDDSQAAMDRTVLELGYRDRLSIPVLATSITPELLTAYRCTALVLVTDGLRAEQIEAAAQCGRIAQAKIAFVSDTHLQQESRKTSRDVDGIMLTLDEPWAWRGVYEGGKRVLDVALSSLALVALSPVFVLVAMLIKLDSAGPVFFVQDRVGLNGRIFRILKFRSMYAGSAQYEPSPTSSLDPRLTKLGRLLRRMSLDELPQLVNVIRGEMSLVGPRPEMPFIVQAYEANERKRLSVMPGITGLWQLSGDRAFPIHENLEYDLYYVQNRGWFMDIAILIHTVAFAMRGGI